MKGLLVHTVTVIAHGIDPLAASVPFKPTRSSPGYEEYYPTYTILDEQEGEGGTVRVKSVRKSYVVVEVSATFDDEEAEKLLSLKDRLNNQALMVARSYGSTELREEFSFYCITDYHDIESYLDKNRLSIAQLLKDERCDIAADEVVSTFRGAVRYEPNDMTIVDWDGALFLDKEGVFEDEITLLELANAQLIALRALDGKLGREIDRFRVDEGGRGIMGLRRLSVALRSIVSTRTASLLELRYPEFRGHFRLVHYSLGR